MIKLAGSCRRYGVLYLQLISVDSYVISNAHAKECEMCFILHFKIFTLHEVRGLHIVPIEFPPIQFTDTFRIRQRKMKQVIEDKLLP